jgi:hypothetical protein
VGSADRPARILPLGEVRHCTLGPSFGGSREHEGETTGHYVCQRVLIMESLWGLNLSALLSFKILPVSGRGFLSLAAARGPRTLTLTDVPRPCHKNRFIAAEDLSPFYATVTRAVCEIGVQENLDTVVRVSSDCGGLCPPHNLRGCRRVHWTHAQPTF